MSTPTTIQKYETSSYIRCKNLIQLNERIIQVNNKFFVFGFNNDINCYCLIVADENTPGHIILDNKLINDNFEQFLEDNLKGKKR